MSAKVTSLLARKFKRVAEQLRELGYDVEELDADILSVGYPEDYFCFITLFEADGHVGIGFDLTASVQETAMLTLLCANTVTTRIMEPSYTRPDGLTLFGDDAYNAFEDFVRQQQKDECDE